MSKDISWQLGMEPGIEETTKFCEDCGKERGISMFHVRPGTNFVTSKYCRVHESIRRSTAKKDSKQAFEDAYERAKNG